MRKLITYFIKYPVAVNIIIIAFVVLGYMGYSNLKTSFFPQTPTNIVSIAVVYPGASPKEVEEGVVLPIENNLTGVVGVDRVTSQSSENAASIMVEIYRDYDIDVVLADIKNAVDKVPNYPVGMEPPVIAKLENIAKSISFAISGDEIPLRRLKETARKIESDLLRMDGISQVVLSGFPDEEIEISVRENDLRAYNLTFQDISNAVSKTSIITTGGSVKTNAEEYLIRAKNRAYTAKYLENVVVKANVNGNSILLKDIAVIKDQFNESPNATFYNGNSAVNIDISNTNNEDLLQTAEKVRAYIKAFNEASEGIKLSITFDTSIVLEQRTELLFENALIGMLLVFIFLALFLKPRLAFWVAFGLPVSFLGMFTFVGYFDITINVLSLFGMIIVIGILVDDGIVIAENIYSEFEKGKSPIKAAIDGTMQVVPAIVSAIITTVLAFSIFLFLDGNIGAIFGEVTIVVAVTLIISLIEALIILPAHIAHSKALKKDQKPNYFSAFAEKSMHYIKTKLYTPAINFFLESVYTKILGLVIPVVLFVITIGAMNGKIIQFTFFPPVASEAVNITLSMPEGTNEKITDSLAQRIENAVWKVNKQFSASDNSEEQAVLNVIKTIGPGTANATVLVNLLPGELRDFSADEISLKFQEEVGEIYGAEQLIFGSGTSFRGKPISVSLVSDNIDDLRQAKKMVKEFIEKNPKVTGVVDTDPEGIKEIKIELKDNAYSLGIMLSDVMTQVRNGFFGAEIQRFQRGKDEIRVWTRYTREERASIKNLENMQLTTPAGNRVAFSEIATYTIERGEVSINHLVGLREVRVDADLKNPKDSAIDILQSIEADIMPKVIEKYPSVSQLFEGQNREAQKVVDSILYVGPIFLLLIYIVIVFTFRSYSQPFILLVIIPFSFIGVAWGHYIHGFPINILSMLGIIALVGIVVNDGLVFITKLNSFLKEGMLYKEAVIEAGKSRFRAIFLTSITTVAGLAPLIFETSRQAQFLIPMAISIAYGITIATVLTLFTLPILLSFFNAGKVHVSWFWNGKKPTNEAVERAIIEMESERENLD
ncbi:efflux RND transporter permease subunit [Kordia jejudonensis]|uniref:efflux RND transporter permease subunit n=1 Tax=Kordia jejudonensis TaxID=1348245 RepID=UPI000629255A|nr:efflux RND transporter permease subunit [Kordia jejudonensis]